MVHFVDQSPRYAVLTEEATEIAWDYLERAGKIDDPERCSYFLLGHIESMIKRGERSRLLLSNRAIAEYLRVIEPRTLEVAS